LTRHTDAVRRYLRSTISRPSSPEGICVTDVNNRPRSQSRKQFYELTLSLLVFVLKTKANLRQLQETTSTELQ